MHDNTAFGKGLAENTRDALKPQVDAGKIQIVYYDAITPGEKDFHVPLTKMRETKPDVWYYTGYYAEAALLVTQAREIGITCPFVGGNAAINDEFVKIAGLPIAKGCYMTNEPLPADLPTKEAAEFLKAYKDKFGDIPSSPWPVYAADAVNIIAYASGQDRLHGRRGAGGLPPHKGERRSGNHRQDRVHGEGRPGRRSHVPLRRGWPGEDRHLQVVLRHAGVS